MYPLSCRLCRDYRIAKEPTDESQRRRIVGVDFRPERANRAAGTNAMGRYGGRLSTEVSCIDPREDRSRCQDQGARGGNPVGQGDACRIAEAVSPQTGTKPK